MKLNEQDESFFYHKAKTLVNKCMNKFSTFDKQLADKYIESFALGVNKYGFHIDYRKIEEMDIPSIINVLRNVNNHRSRNTNIINDLNIPFLTEKDESDE